MGVAASASTSSSTAMKANVSGRRSHSRNSASFPSSSCWASRKNVLPKTKTTEEWQRLFKSIDTRYPTQARNHALIYLMYQVGIRVGEALQLHVSDIDFERMRLRVRDGKTGERNVPLPEDVELRHTVERWLRFRAAWSPESPLLFVTRTGASLHANAVRRSMLLYSERSGIGRTTPHMARHSAASELLANGATPIGVQRILGHRRLTTLLSTYAHAADTHAAAAMAKR